MFSLIKKDRFNLVYQEGKGSKKLLLVVGFLLSAIHFNAHAVLTPYNSNGVDLVYSSVSDVTWTKDADLLGSMMGSQGYDAIVNAIIAASPTITNTPNIYDGYDDGIYNITGSDFERYTGNSNWFGAMAFVNYLNSIKYGGSDQWRLPSAGINPQSGYNQTDSEIGQLFYDELGGTWNNHIPNTGIFDNEIYWHYWSGTEYAPDPNYAWDFRNNNGLQGFSAKGVQYSTWVVSPGIVPIPNAVWLFGSGLLGLLGLKRRWQVE